MIIVMGLPGAGKSTVLAAAVAKGRKIENWGDLMFAIAKEKYGIAHRDELRKLSTDRQKEVQAAVGRKLASMPEIILDTHCSVATEKGYLPGLPYKLLSGLKVDQLILITAPVEEILARRKTDKSRVRDEQSADSLSEHARMNEAYLAAYSALTGAPAKIIVNRNGRLEAAQAELLSLLQ
jgi:adenylate kinase